MSNWFSDMSTRERRTFWACFGGWALDAMDVQLYAVAMPTLIGLWSLSKTQAGALGTSALIVSSLGGWLAGMLADRIGRVKVLQITILWFSFFTFLSGLANSYEQMLVFRSLQGLGFGGEWAAGAVLMAEVINPKVRGRAVGCVQSGWSVGYGAAALLFTAIFSWFPPEVGVALSVLHRHPSRALPCCSSGAMSKSRKSFSRPNRLSKGVEHKSVLLDIFKPPLLRSTARGVAAGRGHSRWELHHPDVAADLPEDGSELERAFDRQLSGRQYFRLLPRLRRSTRT